MADYPECPRCKDIYGNKKGHIKEPKILNCGDSICKECLEDLIKDKNEEFFSCPTCGDKIKNKHDIEEYTTNKELIRMVEECFINTNNNLEKEEVDIATSYNIISLGEGGVGKTSIFKRLSKDNFREDIESSKTFDKGKYYIRYKNKNYKLILHDTVGQEIYKSVSKNYLRNPDGVLFVFDISNRESFNKLESWYNLFMEENERVVGLLIGNKCDLKHEVSDEEAEKFANGHGLKYLETSARLDKKVRKAIAYLLELIIKAKLPEKNIDYCQIDNLSTYNRKKKCC